MSTRILVALAAILLLIPGPAALAADPALDAVLQRYSDAEDMRLTFIQTLTHKESGGKEERAGVLQCKKPLLVHWEITDPAPELLIVGDDGIWNVFPEEELAYKYALELANDSASLIRVMTGLDTLDKDFIVEEGDTEEGMRTIRLYPKNPTQSMTEAVLWLDEKEKVVKRLRVYDFYNNENELLFETQEVNLHPDAALFRYVPPEGFTVEDRTQPGAIENQLRQ